MTTMATRIRDDIIRTGATSMSGKTRPVIDTWQSSAKGEHATCQLSSISTKLQNLDSKLQITNHKSQNTTLKDQARDWHLEKQRKGWTCDLSAIQHIFKIAKSRLQSTNHKIQQYKTQPRAQITKYNNIKPGPWLPLGKGAQRQKVNLQLVGFLVHL